MNAKKAIISLSVLLGLSVCANAFLGGMVIANGPFGGPFGGPPPHMMRGGPDGFDGPPELRGEGPEGGERAERGGPGREGEGRFRGGLRQFARELPDGVREPIMQAMLADREQMGERIQKINENRKAVIAALTAEPFDAEKLSSVLSTQRSMQAEIQFHVHETLLGVISKLTPEQRQQLGTAVPRLFK